jgi:hypothetical protein
VDVSVRTVRATCTVELQHIGDPGIHSQHVWWQTREAHKSQHEAKNCVRAHTHLVVADLCSIGVSVAALATSESCALNRTARVSNRCKLVCSMAMPDAAVGCHHKGVCDGYGGTLGGKWEGAN